MTRPSSLLFDRRDALCESVTFPNFKLDRIVKPISFRKQRGRTDVRAGRLLSAGRRRDRIAAISFGAGPRPRDGPSLSAQPPVNTSFFDDKNPRPITKSRQTSCVDGFSQSATNWRARARARLSRQNAGTAGFRNAAHAAIDHNVPALGRARSRCRSVKAREMG